MSAVADPAATPLAALAALLGEIGDCKRVRDAANGQASVAARGFERAWSALVAGEPLRDVALREAATAVRAARLGAIDPAVLTRAGLSPAEVERVLGRAFDAVAHAIAEPLRSSLRAAAPARAGGGSPPAFVAALAAQPRAGATRPGRPRLVLEPPESHAEHCWVVAVGAVLAGPSYGVEDPAPAFLCGLAHHLHNALLPDSGFAGEALLGEHLDEVVEALTRTALAQLEPSLRAAVQDARALLRDARTPEARAFHAADVLDRVLQMEHYARAARFTLGEALDELELVHEGPLQAFGLEVVREAGLR